jgi:hypothetical protein
MSGKQRKLELSVPQVVGSALAALSAAVAASYLGVAGTVIGAAMMSLASTIAADVYTHYLKRTGDKVKQHTATAWRGPKRPLVLPWARVGTATAVVFTVSMGSILIYQVIADRTVADQVAGRVPVEAEKREVKREKRDGQPVGEPHRDRPATRSPSPTPTPSPSSATPAATPTPTRTSTPTPSVSSSAGPSRLPTPKAEITPSPSDLPPISSYTPTWPEMEDAFE